MVVISSEQLSVLRDIIAKHESIRRVLPPDRRPKTSLPHSTLVEFRSAGEVGVETLEITQADGSKRVIAIRGGQVKSYVELWDAWPSWWGTKECSKSVRGQLKNWGYTDEECRQLMGFIYDGVCYGIIGLILRTDNHALIGIRSIGVSGEYDGSFSLIGGLVRAAGETLPQALHRQIKEEAGEYLATQIELGTEIAVGEHTSAASFTFVQRAYFKGEAKSAVESSTGRDALEWSKGKLVWVPVSLLWHAATTGDAVPLSMYCRASGFNVQEGIKLAGDIVEPLVTLLRSAGAQ